MKLSRVQELLNAKIYSGEDIVSDMEVKEACGSDLMSDVLAFVKDQGLLLTGLQNLQVIRTAENDGYAGCCFCQREDSE